MAVMDAAIFETSWRHTAQIKCFTTNFYIYVLFLWQAVIYHKTNQIYEKYSLQKMIFKKL